MTIDSRKEFLSVIDISLAIQHLTYEVYYYAFVYPTLTLENDTS